MMPDRTKTAMTPAQTEQLLGLFAAGALTRETGVGPYALKACNPNVIGILRDKGLADSRVVRPKGGSQFTAYWLTKAGAAKARELGGPS